MSKLVENMFTENRKMSKDEKKKIAEPGKKKVTESADESIDSYWIILYRDGTYQEVGGSEAAARAWADDHKRYRGGSYRLVEWKD